jgi:flagellar hook-length control protein FliK
MRIQMVLQQGTVSAQFNVNTDQAHQMLNRSLQALKSALEAKGLNVERLTVTNTGTSDGSSAARNDNNAGNHAQHQQSGSQHDAGQGMSRGRSDGGQHDGSAARHGGRSAQTFAEAIGPMSGADASAERA